MHGRRGEPSVIRPGILVSETNPFVSFPFPPRSRSVPVRKRGLQPPPQSVRKQPHETDEVWGTAPCWARSTGRGSGPQSPSSRPKQCCRRAHATKTSHTGDSSHKRTVRTTERFGFAVERRVHVDEVEPRSQPISFLLRSIQLLGDVCSYPAHHNPERAHPYAHPA